MVACGSRFLLAHRERRPEAASRRTRGSRWKLVGGTALDGRRDREAAGLGLFALLDVDFEHAVGVVRPGLDVSDKGSTGSTSARSAGREHVRTTFHTALVASKALILG